MTADVADFEGLLTRRLGLSVESVGSTMLQRAVAQRQRACGMEEAQAYWQKLTSDEAELQELIEAVVVPETWFFRDREAFTAFAQHALALAVAHPNAVLRALSIPCSTGEEPYSMAMALVDAGLAPERFAIDAVDVSERALRHARAAVYGNNSFRGTDFGFRDRHFERIDGVYHLSEQMCARVRFVRANMFGELPLGGGLYDAVFCRNLLIYCGAAAQQAATEVLDRLAAPHALICVGPSETALLSSAGYESARVPLAFAFRKPKTAASARVQASEAPLLPPLQKKPILRAPFAPRPAPPPRIAAALPSEPSLDVAARLADEGRLDEAASTCAEHVRLRGPSSRALHLLGLVSEARGNAAKAAEYHRKALYLDPEHRGALLHLGLLLEKQGQPQAAEALRTRARRLEQKGTP